MSETVWLQSDVIESTIGDCVQLGVIVDSI